MTKIADIIKIVSNDITDKHGADAPYQFKCCITDDVTNSEADFTARYGAGSTYNFPLENYEHGKLLALGLHEYLSGTPGLLPSESSSAFPKDKLLYFFLHIRPVH